MDNAFVIIMSGLLGLLLIVTLVVGVIALVLFIIYRITKAAIRNALLEAYREIKFEEGRSVTMRMGGNPPAGTAGATEEHHVRRSISVNK